MMSSKVATSRVANVVFLTLAVAGCSADETSSATNHANQGIADAGSADPDDDQGRSRAGAKAAEPTQATARDAGHPSGRDNGEVGGRSGTLTNTGSGGSGGARSQTPPRAGATDTAGQDGMASPNVSYVEVQADVTVIATRDLDQPSDLAFNPYVDDELWVVNHGDSAATIIQNASDESRRVLRRIDPEGARHFMPQPTGLAFGARETSIVDAAGKRVEGTFATCPEAPDDFMGPTLWTSDLRIFGIAKEDREAPFNGPDTGAEGPGSHIDMLHRTPDCTGIAWEGAGNVYWTYSGSNAMFVRYDFAKDHGIGNDDHSDGSEWRYAVSGIRYVPNVPSHLAWDSDNARLYMADSGNARVVMFDPAGVTDKTPMSDGENVDKLAVALDMTGGAVQDFVPRSYGMQLPSGVELHKQLVYVSDNESGIIHRFSRRGEPLGKLTIPDLPPRSLAGIAFGPDDKLYLVDMKGSRILRAETRF